MEGIYATGCILFFVVVIGGGEDLPLVEFMFLVFTRMPGGVTVGNSGLCRCVSCVFDGMLEIPNSKVKEFFSVFSFFIYNIFVLGLLVEDLSSLVYST